MTIPKAVVISPEQYLNDIQTMDNKCHPAILLQALEAQVTADQLLINQAYERGQRNVFEWIIDHKEGWVVKEHPLPTPNPQVLDWVCTAHWSEEEWKAKLKLIAVEKKEYSGPSSRNIKPNSRS